MAKVIKLMKANWAAIAAVLATAVAFGTARAQFVQLRQDVDDLQAVKPDVMRAQLDRVAQDYGDLRAQLKTINAAVQDTRNDVSRIRGYLEATNQGGIK